MEASKIASFQISKSSNRNFAMALLFYKDRFFDFFHRHFIVHSLPSTPTAGSLCAMHYALC